MRSKCLSSSSPFSLNSPPTTVICVSHEIDSGISSNWLNSWSRFLPQLSSFFLPSSAPINTNLEKKKKQSWIYNRENTRYLYKYKKIPYSCNEYTRTKITEDKVTFRRIIDERQITRGLMQSRMCAAITRNNIFTVYFAKISNYRIVIERLTISDRIPLNEFTSASIA